MKGNCILPLRMIKPETGAFFSRQMDMIASCNFRAVSVLLVLWRTKGDR